MTAKGPGARTLAALLYQLLRPVLFRLDAERAHAVTLAALDLLETIPGIGTILGLPAKPPLLPVQIMGLTLPNPVGLAAGLDKDGTHIHGLAALGFGWLELGTVTPRPQPGNPRPRLFRLVRERALVNRMGFNNGGAEALAGRVAQCAERPVLGINIGKNRDTPLEQADQDYVQALQMVAPHADYVTINVSSPNTAGLRGLQEERRLAQLLRRLQEAQQRIREQSGRHIPLAVKLAPDLEDDDLDTLADLLASVPVDGVIATNTTLARPGQTGAAGHAGGLSGAPLARRAHEVVVRLRARLAGRLPIIAAGGIMDASDAWERLVAGADALQIYSGLIYSGPQLPVAIVQALRQKSVALGHPDLREALAVARTRHRSAAPQNPSEKRE